MKPDYGHWRRVGVQLAKDIAPSAAIAAVLTGISVYGNWPGWFKAASSYFTTLFFVAAYFSFLQRAEKKVNDKGNHDSLTKQQGAALARLQALSDDLETVTTKIAGLSDEIAGTATGGDSYCYLDDPRPSPGGAQTHLMITTKGRFPLSNVTGAASWAVSEEARRQRTMTILNFRVEFLSLTETYPAEYTVQFPFFRGENLRLHIDWHARNGGWTQRFDGLKQPDGKWICGTVVYRRNELLYHRADEGFPTHADGTPRFDAV